MYPSVAVDAPALSFESGRLAVAFRESTAIFSGLTETLRELLGIIRRLLGQGSAGRQPLRGTDTKSDDKGVNDLAEILVGFAIEEMS